MDENMQDYVMLYKMSVSLKIYKNKQAIHFIILIGIRAPMRESYSD